MVTKQSLPHVETNYGQYVEEHPGAAFVAQQPENIVFLHIPGLELIDPATHKFALLDCQLEPLEIDYTTIRDSLLQTRHARISSDDADAAIDAMMNELQTRQLARILAKRISVAQA